MTDMNTTAREEVASRPAKRKHEKLDLIEEDVGPSELEENARKAEATRKAKAIQQRKLEKRDPKPGYCENCQDKFEDFEEVWSLSLKFEKLSNSFKSTSYHESIENSRKRLRTGKTSMHF
jgi:regulatory subunit for Cdc7p protein kinase